MAISLPRDANHIPTIGGTSNADGASPVIIWADPVTHRLLVDASITGTIVANQNLEEVGGAPITLGQNTMVNSLPVVIASDQSPIPVSGTFSTTTANANNTYGSASSITVGSTATLVSIGSTPAGFKLRGFEGQGDADGQFWIEINNVKKYFGRFSVTDKSFILTLPNPDLITTGSLVTLKVINEGIATSALYEGVLFAE